MFTFPGGLQLELELELELELFLDISKVDGEEELDDSQRACDDAGSVSD